MVSNGVRSAPLNLKLSTGLPYTPGALPVALFAYVPGSAGISYTPAAAAPVSLFAYVPDTAGIPYTPAVAAPVSLYAYVPGTAGVPYTPAVLPILIQAP